MASIILKNNPFGGQFVVHLFFWVTIVSEKRANFAAEDLAYYIEKMKLCKTTVLSKDEKR